MMKRISAFALIAVMVVGFQPVLAGNHNNGGGGKPDHAGGGNDKDEDDGSTDPEQDSEFVICLDPGHGGTEPGAVINLNDGTELREADLNLSVAKRVQEKWEEQEGEYKAHMTRDDDSTLSNRDRYEFCNATDAAALVSIHHDAFSDNTTDYTLGLYHKRSSLELAETVGLAITGAVGNDTDEFRTDRFASGVLIKSDMPSTITEGYFMTDEDRIDKLSDAEDRDALEESEAQAIVEGLNGYFIAN